MKSQSSIAFGAVLALAVSAAAVPAHAVPFAGGTEVTNFNFDSTPNGSTPPTTAPSVDTYPQHDIYAIGGYPDAGTVTGTVTVQDAGTMSHAAVMDTAQSGTGSLYMDTQFHTTGTKVSTSFDLAILAMPLTGLSQATGTAPNGQGFIIQAFGNTLGGVDKVFRFVATPEGKFGLRNNTDGDLIIVGSYVLGQTYHVQIDTDFATQTLDAYIDDTLVADDFAIVSPGATDFEEYFIFQNGVDNVENKAAIDNIVTYDNIRAFGTVPEPLTLSLFGAGLAGMAAARRRKAK